MNNSIVERMRVARHFTNCGIDDFSDADQTMMVDYALNIVQHNENANIDKRVMAIGGDVDALDFEIVSQAEYDVLAHVWSSMAFQTMFESLLSKSLSTKAVDGQKIDVLVSAGSPFLFRQKMLASSDYSVTLINNNHLFYQETFFFPTARSTTYGDFGYSVVDVQDIYSGDTDKSFDLISVHVNEVLDVDTRFLATLMDSVKIGGFLVIRDASGQGRMYDDSLAVHTRAHSDVNRYANSRQDYDSYHVPIDWGSLVCIRTA